jgi:6-phospho-beta-glucosidase
LGELKICVIGGGSTYTPELVEGFIARSDELPVRLITLMDIDEEKLGVVGGLVERMLRASGTGIELSLTTGRREALAGSDYVITQIRVGGLECRIQDEKLPLVFGVVGQETTGPGGFAKALRTIPVLLDITRDMADVAPGARLINFTNPSGLVAEAILKYTDTPTVGLCNSPFGFQQAIAQQLGVTAERVQLDYVGLNHLSWIRGARMDGQDVFGTVLQAAIDEARAGESSFSPELLEMLGMIPSYYLNYYYNHPEVLAGQRRARKTRAEEVREIETGLLELYADPSLRHKPKLLEERGGAHYSTVAVAVISAMHRDAGEVHIVNTRSDGALPGIPPHCVVELPSVLDGRGARALPVEPMPLAIRGLTQTVKAYEELAIVASVEGDEQAALQALVAHPLVPSFAVARELLAAILEANQAHLPQFRRRT